MERKNSSDRRRFIRNLASASALAGLGALTLGQPPSGELIPLVHAAGDDAKNNGIFVNVKDFGAKGDGIADDTRAINKAINSLHTSGTVYFPPGTYMVSGINLERRDGLKLLGSGANRPGGSGGGSTLKAIGPQDYVLRVASLFVQVENLSLDGNLSTAKAVLLFEYLSSGIFVRNVTITRTKENLLAPYLGANLVQLGGDTNLSVEEIVFDGVDIEQDDGANLAGIAVFVRNTNTFVIDFRNSFISGGFNVVKFLFGAGASFHNCEFGGGAQGIFRVEGGTQPIEIADCYTELGGGIPFLYQVSIANDDDTPIVLRHNQINANNPVGTVSFPLIPSQPFLLEGNLIKANVVINSSGSSSFGNQRIIAIANSFDVGHGFSSTSSPSGLISLTQLGTTTTDGLTFTDTNALDSVAVGFAGQRITGHYSGTVIWAPPALANGASATVTMPVPNASAGDTVAVGFDSINTVGWQISGQVIGPGTVAVILTNLTGSPSSLPSGTLRADVWKH